jgi:uncharacterized damage-inducible protein DinB
MTHQDLLTLVDYHYWARDRVLDATAAIGSEEFLRDRGNSFASIRDTLAHVYFAEWVWYSRWQGTSPTAFPEDQFPTADALRRAWAELEGKVRSFVSSLNERELGRVLESRLFNGNEGASPLWHMVQHVVNHASYHRGQVTTMLRQAGAPPPKSMDLITFYRERHIAGHRG